jgi:hypothetical protein
MPLFQICSYFERLASTGDRTILLNFNNCARGVLDDNEDMTANCTHKPARPLTIETQPIITASGRLSSCPHDHDPTNQVAIICINMPGIPIIRKVRKAFHV